MESSSIGPHARSKALNKLKDLDIDNSPSHELKDSPTMGLSSDLWTTGKSKLNPDVGAGYIPSTVPSTHEVGWLGHGHKKQTGKRESVQIKFDPSDPDIQDKFMNHTHPGEPSPLRCLPSETDLISATIVANENGIPGSVIYSGPYYTIVMPTKKVSKSHFPEYLAALQRGDIEDALEELKRAGFDVETGKL